MTIVTSRLTLRTARPDDLDAFHDILSDPEATRWWSTPPHDNREQSRLWLDSMIAKGPDNPDFVVELDGMVIGKAGFFALPEVGYILRRDQWGRGFATEAVSAAIAHVFATRSLDVLTADVDPDNGASIRLLERLGFRQTGSDRGTINVGGVWKDSLYYGLTRSDWNTRPGS
jgi:ribosomal-protein-alanine N-acetyltransferase